MAALTTKGPCGPSAPPCSADGTAALSQWAKRWFTEDEKTGTVMVVQVINTVLNTTSISTVGSQLPPDYTPPATNEGGTRVATFTYTHQGTASTTTVAYPTPFLELPDAYLIAGDWQVSKPNGSQTCIVGGEQIFPIPTNYQPPWSPNDPTWDPTKYLDPDDPLGWGYSFMEDAELSTYLNIGDVIDLLPDDNEEMPHSVVKSCTSKVPVQPAAVSPNSNWRVVAQTSVVYEGDEEEAGTTGGTTGGVGAEPTTAPAAAPTTAAAPAATTAAPATTTTAPAAAATTSPANVNPSGEDEDNGNNSVDAPDATPIPVQGEDVSVQAGSPDGTTPAASVLELVTVPGKGVITKTGSAAAATAVVAGTASRSSSSSSSGGGGGGGTQGGVVQASAGDLKVRLFLVGAMWMGCSAAVLGVGI